jgi:hypothetical protein
MKGKGKMKLAEALMYRADCQKRMERLKQRLLLNLKVQEGDKPSEDPKLLMKELERISDELIVLIQRINRTNSNTFLKEGVTITDALARRDVLMMKISVYRALAQSAVITQERYRRMEVKFTNTVDVASLQQNTDDLSKEHRELDARIQEINWRIELLE